MENNNFWWYLIPFCLGVASLTLTLYGHHERTSKQAVEEPAEVIKTVATEQKKRMFQWVRLKMLLLFTKGYK